MKELQHLNKYFLKYKTNLIIGAIITIVARIFLLFTPRYVKEIFVAIERYSENLISEDVFKFELTQAILYILGAALIAGILTFFMRQTMITVSRYIEYDLKNEIFAQYQRLSLNFYKQNRTGDLMNRITEDVTRVRTYTGPALMYSINTFTLFVIVLIYMFSTAPKLPYTPLFHYLYYLL